MAHHEIRTIDITTAKGRELWGKLEKEGWKYHSGGFRIVQLEKYIRTGKVQKTVYSKAN